MGLWSKFTRLSEPRWCFSDEQAKAEGLTESFAMIRLADQAVVINLAQVAAFHLREYALEILGHEIGHHVYCPADLTDNARMIARMRWALPTKENLAEFTGNLYTDLLINDRLVRSANLRIAQVYLALGGGSQDRMWRLYMRIYEILWSLTRGTLAAGPKDDQLEGDAQLGARVVRSFARDWLEGAGRFAALCFPYLVENDGQAIQKILRGWRDTRNAGAGGIPAGLTRIEPGEREGAIHPALDPEISGLGRMEGEKENKPAEVSRNEAAGGQSREPFEYGQILKALGVNLSDHEIAVRYYRERAVPYLVPFPTRVVPRSTEPLPEGLETWDVGSPLEDIDWAGSLRVSPQVIPGLTTLQRTWGTSEGEQPAKEPFDLDLYVDSSGSMPNPQVNVSYLALAGAIIAISALRAGAQVQATLWSGPGQFEGTKGFVREEQRVLSVVTGYIGGGTAFPIHVLRDTYQDRKPTDRPAHIMVISDDGVTTLFDKDEKNNSGWDIARMALKNAMGGGTMALNLAPTWEWQSRELIRARQEGWGIFRVASWSELVEFARAFGALKYGQGQ